MKNSTREPVRKNRSLPQYEEPFGWLMSEDRWDFTLPIARQHQLGERISEIEGTVKRKPA
jgi:hypothetical protein